MIGESAGKQRSSQLDQGFVGGRKDQQNFYKTQTLRGISLADGESSGKSLRIASSRNGAHLVVDGVPVGARLTYQKYSSKMLAQTPQIEKSIDK